MVCDKNLSLLCCCFLRGERITLLLVQKILSRNKNAFLSPSKTTNKPVTSWSHKSRHLFLWPTKRTRLLFRLGWSWRIHAILPPIESLVSLSLKVNIIKCFDNNLRLATLIGSCLLFLPLEFTFPAKDAYISGSFGLKWRIAKGGLISESFSIWLKSSKIGAKSLSWAPSIYVDSVQDSDLAPFFIFEPKRKSFWY